MIIQKEFFHGVMVVRMQNENLALLICPEDGMNIYSIQYKGQPTVSFDEEKWSQGRTFSVPILYPTPNRVENDKFWWEGVAYTGKTHGLVKNAPFEITKQLCKDDKIVLEGRLDWRKGSEFYVEFSFESLLDIQITLQGDKINYK